ncbi:MAG: ABC transporter substrate-binding protein [Candidatus Tectomicrobia bacterium]|nr:ABC transporter substrate-binding protein [Candidatus Tectomicrobia bacterium]
MGTARHGTEEVMRQPRSTDAHRGHRRTRGRRWPYVLACVVLLVGSGWLAGVVGTAERARPIHIGALTLSWGPSPTVVGLREGLMALGYREDQHFVLGVRFTQGDPATLPAAAQELAHAGVDLLFADSHHAAKAAPLATTQIPIVFAAVADPLGMGLIQSFARPGGILTGVTTLGLELAPKRLELFRELVPGLVRVLFCYAATDALAAAEAQDYREAARRLRMTLVEKPVRTPEEAQAALAQARRGEVDGILKPRHVFWNIPGFMLETAVQQAIPTLFDDVFYVERGGLVSYGPNAAEAGRQAARLVNKVLNGVAPRELPVEVNQKIELAINLKAAEALGLTIPPALLFQADRVIR